MSFISDLGETFGLGDRPSYKPKSRVDVDEAVKKSDFYSQDVSQFQNDANQRANTQGRRAPQTEQFRIYDQYAHADRSQQQDLTFASAQNRNIQQLEGIANGTAGPSAAQLAMQRQSQQSAQQNLMMASAAGGGPGSVAAAIAAQNRNAVAQGQLQQDLGVQRAQEQMMARQLFGAATDNARGQSLGAAQAYTDRAVGMDQQNQANQLQASGMDDAMKQFHYGQALQAAGMEQSANIDYANTKSNYLLGLESANASRYATREQAQGQRFGAGVGMAAAGIGAMAMMSDVREKTAIEPDKGGLSSAFRKLPAYSYDYKRPEEFGYGRQTGIMAQDLERNPATQAAVIEGPGGRKMVDGGKLATMTAAEVANQRRELDALKAAAQAPATGQRASGGLARGLGAFGAGLTGGQNVAGAALDEQDRKRAEAAKLLEELNRRQTDLTGAIVQPQVAYPYNGPVGSF